MALENEILEMSLVYDYNGRGFENMEVNGLASYNLNSRVISVVKQYLKDNCISFSDKDPAFSLLCSAQSHILYNRIKCANPDLKPEIVNEEIVTYV